MRKILHGDDNQRKDQNSAKFNRNLYRKNTFISLSSEIPKRERSQEVYPQEKNINIKF